MKKEIIISALISLGITGGLGLYIAHLYSQPNPTLRMTDFWIDEFGGDIDFDLSNDQTGIALVDKIELDVKNFEIIEGCSGLGTPYLRLFKFVSETIYVEQNPRIYTVDNILDTDRDEWFPISDHLKFGEGDIDQFTIRYRVPENSVNNTHGYSFDFIVRTEWHDPSKSNDKRTVESSIQNVQRLGYCYNLDGNLGFP